MLLVGSILGLGGEAREVGHGDGGLAEDIVVGVQDIGVGVSHDLLDVGGSASRHGVWAGRMDGGRGGK